MTVAPVAIALIGIFLALRLSRKRSQPVTLSDEEKRRLAQLKAEAKDD